MFRRAVSIQYIVIMMLYCFGLYHCVLYVCCVTLWITVIVICLIFFHNCIHSGIFHAFVKMDFRGPNVKSHHRQNPKMNAIWIVSTEDNASLAIHPL